MAPKVVFDFDRRAPAGPYQLDLTVAERAAHAQHGEQTGARCTEETLLKSAESPGGKERIPQREAAALRLCLRVHQRTSRDS